MDRNANLLRPEEVLPHRPPHPLLDGVTELNEEHSAKGFWTPPEDLLSQCVYLKELTK